MEGNGRGRGRAAMMARILGEESSKALPAVGRGSLLRGVPNVSSTSDAGDATPPSEPKPRGRGAILQSLSAALSENQTSPPDLDSSNVPQILSEPTQPDVSRLGGRGRAHIIQNIARNTAPEVIEMTQQTSSMSLQRRSPSKSEEKPPPVQMHGTSGRSLEATANYIRLELRDPTRGIHEYEISFNPDVDNHRERQFLAGEQFRKHGGLVKIFDGGTLLYSPQKLENELTRGKSKLRSGVEVEVFIKYKRTKKFTDCKHVLNVIFKRIMSELQLVKFGRSDFNPNKVIKIQQHKLSIWPGCITAVDEYEGGIHLCLDASHRVLRDQTCLSMIQDIVEMSRSNRGVDLKDRITTAFIGTSVITTYNNKVYKVDDVDFNVNPLSKFSKNGQEISYIDYYQQQYNLQIKDQSQPLLVHRLKKKPLGKENVDILLLLVPELCCPTGLTDEMRGNHKLMRDVAEFTRCSPNERQRALTEFVRGIKENQKAAAHLNDWGLSLPEKTASLMARVLDPEKIIFANKKVVQDSSADWNRALGTNGVISTIPLKEWIIIYVNRDVKFVNSFIEMARKIAPGSNMMLTQPRLKSISNDHTRSFVEATREALSENIQMIVYIFPSNRDDRYSAIKKLCNAELGVASQVINSKTLAKPNALKSIVLKIVWQMNCKIGGALWQIPLPYKEAGIMFCGIDAYHEALKKTQSVIALVSSLNTTSTRWTSAHSFHHRGQEISDVITGLLKENLQQWYKANGSFPARIVVYRDGVGDGQLKTVRDFEVPQFERMFALISSDYKPMLTYVIVQKRITTRIYARKGNEFINPPPGTVMDHDITRRNWYDFFLVSQNVRQGTVSPTHYVVVKDSSDMTPDQVQKLSYKMTHVYYNWSGTVRVPAPCQYAHKLAYLIGQHVHAPVKENLRDLLYFL